MKRYVAARHVAAVALLVVAVAGCGAPPRSAAAPPPPDPFALVGWWQVEGTGQTVLLDPSAVEVRDGTRTLDGSWRADPDGRFLAGISSGSDSDASKQASLDPPAWLASAVAYTVDGAARTLNDRAGAQVARLLPAQAGPVTGQVDPSRAPSDAERRAAQPAALPPSGLLPAGPGDLVGTWTPEGFTGASRPGVTFGQDGTWSASDGCNANGGAWLAGADGGFLATSSTVMTLIACEGKDVGTLVGGARRVALDDTTLVLLDAAGQPTGRFTRT